MQSHRIASRSSALTRQLGANLREPMMADRRGQLMVPHDRLSPRHARPRNVIPAIPDLVQEVGDIYEPIAENKSITLHVDLAQAPTVVGDRDLLQLSSPLPRPSSYWNVSEAPSSTSSI